jgi:gamma-glutamyltranspeptidase/glutathione hydrolase
MESGIPVHVAENLRQGGFTVVQAKRPLGGAQAVWIDWETGVLLGGSDPRKDGCALGY